MEKYNKYKDSGIAWLGVIPEHWEVKRLKDLAKKIGSGATPLTSNAENYDKPEVFWVNTGDLNDGYVNNSKRKISKRALVNYPNLKSFPVGTLIMAMYGATIGKLGILNIIATTNQACCCINLYEQYPAKYLFYWLLSDRKNIISLSVGGTQPNISQSIINKLDVFLPPLVEQTQIAIYLDAKTTAIDKKIKLLKQKIKHYKAYRKTLINETVTKGLKNDISNWKNYRLKDIGYLYSGLSGKSGDDFNQDNNLNNRGFIPFTNIANNTYLNKNHLGTVVIEENEKQNQVKQNDIFFLMSSEGYEDIGKSAVLIDDIKETYLNSFCKGFRITNNNCVASFINYLLLSNYYRQKMLVQGKGFTRINLKMEKVNNFSILIPSTKKEQQQIVAYLDAKTSTIDRIVNNIETQITTLKELRKTLINEVVTGRVKVTA
jgi:type I restriction enzyme, S subunit